MLEEDIHDKLMNPPPKKLIFDEDSGQYISVVEISDVLQAPYRKCRTCNAKYRCSKVQKEGKIFLDVNCIIEEEALDVILNRLTLDGVTTQDEMLVFPLIRNTFLLIRLYEVESIMDLGRILKDEEAMKTFKEINSMINKSETQVIKFLKELTVTKKEIEKRTVHSAKSTSKTFDLAKKLGAKNRASKQQAITQGKEKDNT